MKILLPTDFSQNAKQACDYGIKLLGKSHEYYLLNCFVEPSSGTTTLMSLKEILRESSAKYLEQEKVRLESSHTGIKINVLSEYGMLTGVIENLKNRIGQDMVVMGTHGASGLKEVFIGSNTAEVIKKAVCPVLSIPMDYSFTKMDKIAFSSDLKGLLDLSKLDLLISLIESNKSKVDVLNISQNNDIEDSADKLTSLNWWYKLGKYVNEVLVLPSQDVVKSLEKLITENNYDLVVMVPRRNNFFDAIFHKSVTNKIALHAKRPLLTINDF